MLASIKIQNEETSDIRRVKVPQLIKYNELVELLKTMFKLPDSKWECLCIKYTDNENDICSITSDLELSEAFDAKKEQVLKLVMHFVKEEKNFSCKIDQRPRQCRRWGGRRSESQSLHEEGIALMDAKKYEEAIIVFSKQADMLPPWRRSSALYNIACCESLLGNVDSSLALLSKAIELGFRDVSHIENDEDLENLRGLSGFEVLLSELRTKQERPNWRGRWQRQQSQQPQQATYTDQQEQIPLNFLPGILESLQPLVNEVVNEVVKPFIANLQQELEKQEEVKQEPVKQEEVKQEEVKQEPQQEPVKQEEVKQEEVKQEPQQEPVKQEEVAKQEVKENIQGPVCHQYEAELAALEQMGFTNTYKNVKVLMKTKGNLSAAVSLLLQ